MKKASVPNPMGRREFIYNTSLASISMLFLGFLTGGCEDILKAIANRPVRRMIRNTIPSNQSTDLYRLAVAAMKALPSSDPRNWNRQAKIHDDFCPHGNWFFFPWHRAYLFEFEKICQKLSGDDHFGLPYWNWSLDGHIPSPYWTPPATNALYDNTRLATASGIASTSSVGLPLVDGFCNENDFTLFAGGKTTGLRTGGGSYGNIEQTPHNYIHGTFIRGNMGNFMAPLDPIFWNHHCMVDLCWNEWNITRNHANTNDPIWSDFNMSNMFCDADGNTVTDMTVLGTVLMPILSYQYETDIAGNNSVQKQAMRKKADFERMKKIIQEGSKIELKKRNRMQLKRGISFHPKRPLTEKIIIEDSVFIESLGLQNKERVILSIKNMSHPINSDVFIRVFVNKSDSTVQTPIEDIHYAGSFYFFTHGMAHEHSELNNPDIYVDITPALNRMKSNGELDGVKELNISLVAVPVPGVTTATQLITADDLEIFISPVEINIMDIK